VHASNDAPLPPYSPDRLYSPRQLFDRFDPHRVGSYVDTFDAQTYLLTRTDHSDEAGMRRAVHDFRITEARDAFIAGRRIIAIMGGHSNARTDPAYRVSAELSRRLSLMGILMTSGGGPGIMEATHLGALCAHSDALEAALLMLSGTPTFPHGMSGLVPTGATQFDASMVAALHPWQAAAFAVLDMIPESQRGESLAIPTWFYGHEPPTPFATHIAKYFANALREDGLLAIAGAGIVYAPGSAGTIQEVFQDAAQNFYESFGRFSPMVFVDLDGHWTQRFPVERLLRPLFGDERYERWVRITVDEDEMVDFLTSPQN
jgi:predicted Rossmann-fold nucleotide-binding protein